MSSSRVHSSFTGLFAAFAHSTAAGMKSTTEAAAEERRVHENFLGRQS
jgi:hypothetical protein